MEQALQLAAVAVLVALYAWLAVDHRRRGHRLGWRRPAAFAAAVALLLAAALPPIEPLSDQLFSAHMTQHLLLGDLAPLLVALSLDGAMLRPLLAHRRLRSLQVLLHPVVALSVWTADLAVWHTTGLYDAALRSAPVHALEHVCFFTAGLVMWMALLETLPGPRWFTTPWKAGYVLAVRAVGMTLGNIAFWAGPLYPAYAGADRPFGLSMATDQQLAGAIMMTEGSLVTVAALVWLGLVYLRQAEAGQRLAERGVDARAAARAVRFARADRG